jgi:heme-degrading monooxygenase HmoA
MVLMVTRRLLDEGDFDDWKKRFEAQAEVRKAAGCRGVRRMRGVENPRELVVIFDWDTIENAKAFVGIKTTEKPELLENREDAAAPKLDIVFVEEMPPLAS